MDTVQSKVCPLCTGPLPISRFGLCRARKDGKNLYCKSCIREKVTKQRQVLKEYKSARKKYLEPSFEPQSYSPKSVFRLSPVEKVKDAIERGFYTQREIRSETKLGADEIGDALASLLLWTKEIRTQIVEGTRLYFPVEIEEKPAREYEPVDPFCEVARKSNQLVVKGERRIQKVA